MSNWKPLLIALALTFGFSATAFAKVNCQNAKNKNQDECVQAKVNNNANNINCSDVKNKNRDECARMKANNNKANLDDVNCSNANDPEVRRACRKAKY